MTEARKIQNDINTVNANYKKHYGRFSNARQMFLDGNMAYEDYEPIKACHIAYLNELNRLEALLIDAQANCR